MITIFSCPKAFIGEFGIIQEKAIQNWLKLIKYKLEVILLGNEEGITNICKKYHLIHIPNIERNEYNTPLLNDIFKKAEKRSKNNILLYVNSDILFFSKLDPILNRLLKQFTTFVASGQRHEGNIQGKLKSKSWMDYFLFTKGVWKEIPPFALGRTFWDKWLIWKTIDLKLPVVDLTPILKTVHQSHSYTYNRMNKQKVWSGKEAYNNLLLAEGWNKLGDLRNATWIYETNKVVKNTYKKIDILPIILDKLPFTWPYILKHRAYFH